MRAEALLDAGLSRLFGALGFRKCSKCYVRVRRAQLMWFLTRRVGYRQIGWPEEFKMVKVMALPGGDDDPPLGDPQGLRP